MNILIAIIIIFCMALFLFYGIKSKNRRIDSINKENQKQEQEIQEQNQKNVEYVAKIINGSYNELSEEQQSMYINAFDKWQKYCKEIFAKATTSQKNKIVYNLNNWEHLNFKGVYSSKEPEANYELFLENCFTEPFPSTHDMDDFFRRRVVSELTVLNVIESKNSENYYAHIKAHFVNHSMVKAIMVLDIYRKK